MRVLYAGMRAITVTIAIGLTPTLVQADIYKWVDAHGQVHFSDAAPRHVNATTVQKDAPETKAEPSQESVSSETLLQRQQRFTLTLEKERKAREALAAKEKTKQDTRDAACQRARNRLDHFKSVNRFYQENQDGTITYLSDKEGDAFRRDAQAAYQQHCNDDVSMARH